MSKHFKKFVEDEELYQATYNFVLDIDRPKYNEKMSLQDYGAFCVAFDSFRLKLQQRLDDMYREGEE